MDIEKQLQDAQTFAHDQATEKVLEELKAEYVKKCLHVGELCYRQMMDQLMIDELAKEIQIINQKAAEVKPKEEKHE